MSRSIPPLPFLTLSACASVVALSCIGCGQRATAPVPPPPAPTVAGTVTYSPSEQQARKQAWAQSQEAFMKTQLQNRPGAK